MLLKSAAIFRCSKSIISFGVQSIQDVKDLEERVTLLRNEKLALEKAKQELSFKVDELKGQVRSKDQQLEELRVRLSELEKAHVDSSKVISKLKAEVKYIEEQWQKSAFKIKGNILAQSQVICLEANFSEVRLDKHVVDGRIEVIPDDDDEGGLGSEPTNPAADS